MNTTPLEVMMGFSVGHHALASASRRSRRGHAAFAARMALANSTSDFSLRRCTLADALSTVGGAK